MTLRDLTGKIFNRLRVVRRVKSKNGRAARWRCICICGKRVDVDGVSMVHGRTKSCGCFQKEVVKKTMTTHGLWRTRTYNSWDSMIQRCTNSNTPNWENYGGRGISVCERWMKFENFLTDMGVRPKGKSLDRFPDKNGDYKKSNCRWASHIEQMNNRIDNNKVFYLGDMLTIAQLSRLVGVNEAKLRSRINRNWSLMRAIISP